MIGAILGLAAAVSMTTAQANRPSFCQRMAAKLPMKEKRTKDSVRAFDMQTMSATQRWLTGGTTSFSMKVDAIDGSPAEEKRVASTCGMAPCTLEGPLRFTLG